MFICFEGIDGSGKSTQARSLASYLEDQGHKVSLVREPGGTRISDAVRNLLLDTDHSEMDAHTEALLYLAARAQLVAEQIRPALQAGSIIITDRYSFSTFAYQGRGRGIDLSLLRAANSLATGEVTPDIVFLLDLPVEQAAKRRRHSVDDRIESAGEDFQEKVRQGYLELSLDASQSIQVIDASRSENEIQLDIMERLNSHFPDLIKATQ